MLTHSDIADLAKRVLKRDGDIDPYFIIEGKTKTLLREFPNLPEKPLVDLLECFACSIALMDEIGELENIFFAGLTWCNKNPAISAHLDPHGFEALAVLEYKPSRSGEFAFYQIIRSKTGLPLEILEAEEDTETDLSIGFAVDALIRGFKKGRWLRDERKGV